MITNEYYQGNKEKLLQDKNICAENRQLFKEFFEHEEYKLKRKNNLSKLDKGCLLTLNGYTMRLRNVNQWFHNQPLKSITREDIKAVYDGLEDGKILTARGKPFKDRKSYYNKVFRSKLFQMVGKADLAREVIEFYKPADDTEVRFVTEEDFRKMASQVNLTSHQALLWVSWDIGENINSLLRLKKKDFVKQKNLDTKDSEYRVNLRGDILKRSRTPRSEITNYGETVQFLDQVLEGLKDDDLVFPITYSATKKFFMRSVKLSGVKCLPGGQKPTWKDLRSSMACDLLKKGWSTDEVNARLGHRPSSAEIDKYVTFLAIDRHKPKKKSTDDTIIKLREELAESKELEKLQRRRVETLQSNLQDIEAHSNKVERQLKEQMAKVLAQVADLSEVKKELARRQNP